MLHPLDLIVQTGLSPEESLAADRLLLDEVARPSRECSGALRVYDLAGDVLCLGRYHLAPERSPPGIGVWRRHSGGRAMPWGAGFVGLSLALPHRSALVAPDPLALAPEQVLNRYVRGILAACELIGMPSFYPGRDLVTSDHRMLAMVSFEIEPSGALLFQAVIADDRDFSVLPALLDRADPAGVIKGGMVHPDEATCLAARLGHALGAAALAERVRRGYEERLGVHFNERALAVSTAFDARGWLGQRRRRTGLDRHVQLTGQLGVVELFYALEDTRIREVLVTGDLIASSSTVERLEAELRGCAAERAAVETVVTRVLAEPTSVLLGLGPPRAVAEAIAGGLVP